MTSKSEIAQLRAELAAQKKKIAQLEGAQAPYDPEADARSTAEWRDKMRAAEDARFLHHPHSPEQMRRYNAAWSANDCADINRASRAPKTPSGLDAQPSSVSITGGHWLGRGIPGDGFGWKPQRDWGADGKHPTPHVDAVDRVALGIAAQEKKTK